MTLTPVEIRDAALMALSSLWANKLRSFLTILGVMVGVGSVIAMASIVDGLQRAAEEEVSRRGTNVMNISRFAPNTDYSELSEEERNRPHITVGEALAIRENCPSVAYVVPRNHYFRSGGNEAKYKNRKTERPTLMGTWPDYIAVWDKEIRAGRFISDADEQFRLMVCVLGAAVADALFEGGEQPIGQEIRVNDDKFTVIGVFENVESNFGNDFDDRLIIIPLSTYQKLVPWEKALGLDVKAVSRDKVERAEEEVISALRIYRKVPFNKPNNFAISTEETFREMINDITNILYIAAFVITSVGLMVGGIGVMNIMLVSVTERTREIGVRKAIGAKKSNIVLQFLTEAMTLSGTGGVIGVVGGIGLGVVINSLFGFPLAVSFFWMTIGFIVAVSVGLVSGVYPAIKAARLDPIEALRYE
ncbi:MAG: ABC transporter permease [Candidatus Zixiibacteriota bacterium]|nr:MAG: ABC transporter permease [candidate division Zixibacteria bacterium]